MKALEVTSLKQGVNETLVEPTVEAAAGRRCDAVTHESVFGFLIELLI